MHTNPWGRLKWPYWTTRLTAHFMCGLMSHLMICKFRKSMVIHDIECSFWNQVSLNNTNPALFEWYWLFNFGSVGRNTGYISHFFSPQQVPRFIRHLSCLYRVCVTVTVGLSFTRLFISHRVISPHQQSPQVDPVDSTDRLTRNPWKGVECLPLL